MGDATVPDCRNEIAACSPERVRAIGLLLHREYFMTMPAGGRRHCVTYAASAVCRTDEPRVISLAGHESGTRRTNGVIITVAEVARLEHIDVFPGTGLYRVGMECLGRLPASAECGDEILAPRADRVHPVVAWSVGPEQREVGEICTRGVECRGCGGSAAAPRAPCGRARRDRRG